MSYELIDHYYDEIDYNCSETMLHYANDKYGLNIPEEYIRLVSGFGGGLCCERTCGALCGSVAAISRILITSKAHDCEEMKPVVSDLVSRFEEHLKSCECAKLKEMYRTDEKRCLETLHLASDVLDAYMPEVLKIKEEQR